MPKSLLGEFIPNLSQICRPIHDLTKKNTAFVWGPQKEEAFQHVKEVLTSDLIIKPFDPKLPSELYTDASRIGIGYLLCQRNAKNELQLVKCRSRSLTPAEKNDAVTELEALGVYFAVTHLTSTVPGKYSRGHRHD